MSRLLRLFPRTWRASYGSEVADMLASSGRPWRDRADLVHAAAAVRGHQLVDALSERTDATMWYLRAAGLGLVVLGLVGGFWATPRLADGIVEIPLHWWSMLAVLPLVGGIVLLAAAWWLGRSRGGPIARS